MHHDQESRQHALEASHLPWQLTQVRNPLIHSIRFGESWSIACSIGAMRGRRGKLQLAETPGEFIALLGVAKGSEIMTQNGYSAFVTPGTAVFWDSVRPVECENLPGLQKRTTFFRRDLMTRAFPSIERQCGVAIPRSGRLDILMSWLDTASKAGEDDADLPGEVFERVSIELIRSVFDNHARAYRSHETMLTEAKWLIRRHALDADFTVVGLAAELGISVRAVHDVFAGEALGPGALIRRERLEYARQRLHSATNLDIADLGASLGYSTPSAFSRAFRQQFGRTPSEERAEGTARRARKMDTPAQGMDSAKR